MHEIDRATVELLAEALLEAYRDHCLSRPLSRNTVLEALNAFAAATGFILQATGFDPAALEFHTLALNNHIEEAKRGNQTDC